MKIAFCSDIHAHRHEHRAEIAELVAHINSLKDLDAFVFLGDVSHHTDELSDFLRSITVECPRLWIPGNHDLWVIEPESADDTPDYRYQQRFAEISIALGWHYLPAAPFYCEQSKRVVLGSIGWFSGQGYSEWFDEEADERNEQLALTMANDLENQLLQVPDDFTIILAVHHVPHAHCIPEYARDQGRVNHYIQALLPLYKDRIDLVIHGHYHARYEPVDIEGIKYVAHPFGYPRQHEGVADGVRVIEIG